MDRSFNFFPHEKGFHALALPPGAALFGLQELADLGQHVFVVAENDVQAEKIYESLSSFYHHVLYFPAIDLMPFSHGVPSLDVLSQRVKVLSLLRKNKYPYIITVSYRSFIRVLPPVRSFDAARLTLKLGDSLDFDQLMGQLHQYGYTQTSLVREEGEAALKNRLLDVYPGDSESPVRLIIEDGKLARISFFDPHTQLTSGHTQFLEILPLAEFVFPKDKAGFEGPFTNPLAHSNFVDFYTNLSLLKDYVREREFSVLFMEKLESEDNKIRAVFARLGAERLLASSMYEAAKDAYAVYTRDAGGKIFPNTRAEGNFSGGFSGFVVELEKLFENYPDLCACFFAEYKESARRIAVMLRRFRPKTVKSFRDIPENARGLFIIEDNWEFGFFAQNSDTALLCVGEADVSGKKKLFRKRLKQAVFTPFESEIEPGDAVVHLNYGIGVFRGIERIAVLEKEKDYILIEYADQQKLFVPLEQADLIGRYAGGLEDKKPKLDSLSGKSWHKKKAKAQEDILRFAKELVQAHAKRVTLEGFEFPADAEEQKAFEDQFSYIETPDQIRVIEEIKSDMEDSKPMDRLLCGDVGFGKTEMALRAAFKAIFAGKQVALLAPTTILAEQHYLTCLERFKDFPVKIESLTRFTGSAERKDILKRVAEQKIDMLIGTHALLSKDLIFKDLGLLIIDEEHKFGVEHKEKMKMRYPLTDILSLSATPIPRTLSLALGNFRSLSTLQTPPDLRIPVETIVSDFRPELIKEAIRFELDRGGQVYFIQNRIKELHKFAEMITELVPEASIVTAHGRMEEDELEDAFLGFMRGYYNVLVSTTIVESGLDIPNANTLIVSDAQRLGLSQLYQLKGRVGRSNKQAYAYFLFPEHKNITEAANKRLDALAEYTELGAGFQIAKQDMEIRGAGNVLGAEQHGHLTALGYDMYMKLLREEVQKLQGKVSDETEPLVDLSYDAFIPDEYIHDPALKMEAYKKIVSVKEQSQAEELKKELRDRYGSLPGSVLTLFEIARLKIEAGRLGVASITEKKNHIEILFSHQSKADPLKVMAIARDGSHPVSFNPYNPNLLIYQTFAADAEQKVHRLTAFFRDIRLTE